jgi:hypothetical protein
MGIIANATMYDTKADYVPPTQIVPADKNAIAFDRNTTEVLSIVYGGGMGSGLFFPEGLTGNHMCHSM